MINGEKTSISAADQADITVVFGRTGSVESAAHGVTALLVPMDTPGVTTNRFDCHGQRAIGRGSIFFENVRVPLDHRLGDENKGFVQVMQGFDFSRALIGLQVLAVARVALEETWEYVAAAPGLRQAAVGVPGRVAPARRLRHPGRGGAAAVPAGAVAQGQGRCRTAPKPRCASGGHRSSPTTSVHQCLLMFGHGGYDRGPMEQRLRDVLGFQIGDGTAQIMKTIVARARAGRSAVHV